MLTLDLQWPVPMAEGERVLAGESVAFEEAAVEGSLTRQVLGDPWIHEIV